MLNKSSNKMPCENYLFENYPLQSRKGGLIVEITSTGRKSVKDEGNPEGEGIGKFFENCTKSSATPRLNYWRLAG